MQQITHPPKELRLSSVMQSVLGAIIILCLILLLLSPLSLSLGAILLSSEKWPWYLTRASGAVGYLLLAASTIWGLLLSTKLVKATIPAALSLAMHTYLSWMAVAVTAFHAFILLFDSYFTYTVADIVTPFVGPYKPMWVGLGTVSFYVMLLTSASFYMRRWIGQTHWRRLHYLTFLVYWVVTLHGWVAGTDAALLQWMYLGSAVLVLFLTVYRVMDSK